MPFRAKNRSHFKYPFKYADTKERKFLSFLILAMSLAISMVIVARPNHEVIPDFDYRYTGAAFYFYCILLALVASLLLKAKKEYALKIIFPIVISIFAAQQAFSFYTLRIKEESVVRGAAIVHLRDNLLPELRALSSKDASLTIPNLAGAHILEAMPGLTLADYLIFFTPRTPVTVIQNAEIPPPDVRNHTVTMVKSLRESTSQSFKEALGQPGALRSYYTASSLMTYSIATSSPAHTTTFQKEEGDILIRRNMVDPEKAHLVIFSFSTDNVPGNLEITFSFKNDFDVTGAASKIRVDDYTPFFLEDGRRVYRMETDLLQVYAYALSEKVSNLRLHIPKTKNASFIEAILP